MSQFRKCSLPTCNAKCMAPFTECSRHRPSKKEPGVRARFGRAICIGCGKPRSRKPRTYCDYCRHALRRGSPLDPGSYPGSRDNKRIGAPFGVF